MKESVGYTLTFNIMMIFIVIVFTFISAALIYYKSHKATNLIVSAIDESEGYNQLAQERINRNLNSLGYNVNAINCDTNINDDGVDCRLVDDDNGRGRRGYCIYSCEENLDYYYYKVRINMMISVPIINNILDIPIYSNSNRLYNFEK